MGIVAAQRLPRLKNAGSFLIGFAIFMPLFNAFIGVFIARFLSLGPGNDRVTIKGQDVGNGYLITNISYMTDA